MQEQPNSMLIPSILVPLVLVAAAMALGAEEFKSEAGGFAILAPVELKEQTTSVDSVNGKIDTHMFQGDKNGKRYVVGYTDYPADLIKQEGADKLLDLARDGAAKSLNGKVANESKIALDGNPGRELDLDAKQDNADTKYKMRLYMAGNRLYQIVIAAQAGKAAPEEVNDFLNSFKLNKK
ncbi:MAG TPA: hypothetical protein VKX17_03180 [Planctomycetota bacterium]|nr:hypothetical protein [Planctomycetota bacterium]